MSTPERRDNDIKKHFTVKRKPCRPSPASKKQMRLQCPASAAGENPFLNNSASTLNNGLQPPTNPNYALSPKSQEIQHSATGDTLVLSNNSASNLKGVTEGPELATKTNNDLSSKPQGLITSECEVSTAEDLNSRRPKLSRVTKERQTATKNNVLCSKSQEHHPDKLLISKLQVSAAGEATISNNSTSLLNGVTVTNASDVLSPKIEEPSPKKLITSQPQHHPKKLIISKLQVSAAGETTLNNSTSSLNGITTGFQLATDASKSQELHPKKLIISKQQVSIAGETTILYNSTSSPNGVTATDASDVLAPKTEEPSPKKLITSQPSTAGETPAVNNSTSPPTLPNEDNNNTLPPSQTVPHDLLPPFSPHEAVKYYSDQLTDYERSVEIYKHKKIWYLGLDACKIHGAESLSPNLGFDDDKGNYLKIGHDHIFYRYEIINLIGKGSFGQVIKALDHKTNQHVAIKIIRNKWESLLGGKNEVTILQHLRNKDQDSSHNIVRLLDFFYFRNHLCIVLELMKQNLYHYLKLEYPKGMDLHQIWKIALSLVRSLHFLARENIIHADIKPENIVLTGDKNRPIKLIDFGSACFAKKKNFPYIQSRFYRSPEIILGIPYGTPVDIWSLGCVLAELYTGAPLFPAKDEEDLVDLITQVLGCPPLQLLREATNANDYFDDIGRPKCLVIENRGRKPGSLPLSTAIRSNDSKFIDFISQCLRWDPKKRMDPKSALCHAWLMSGNSYSY